MQIADLPDIEFSRTFFSSVSRRPFGTVGVAPELEFVAIELDPLRAVGTQFIANVYANRGSLRLLFELVLGDVRRMTPLELYLRSESPGAATRALIDYDRRLRDLAYTDIFAGELLEVLPYARPAISGATATR